MSQTTQCCYRNSFTMNPSPCPLPRKAGGGWPQATRLSDSTELVGGSPKAGRGDCLKISLKHYTRPGSCQRLSLGVNLICPTYNCILPALRKRTLHSFVHVGQIQQTTPSQLKPQLTLMPCQ
jgi:hypothetical protein